MMGHKMKPSMKNGPSLGVMEFETEDYMVSVTQRFEAGASMKEGVSGRKMIDTTYENNRPAENVHPYSSDVPGEDP